MVVSFHPQTGLIIFVPDFDKVIVSLKMAALYVLMVGTVVNVAIGAAVHEEEI